MGCSDPIEKLEDEMMKMKMARIELQMQRYNQLKLLKNIDGIDVTTPVIPDYIDPQFLKDQLIKNVCSSTTLNKVMIPNLKTKKDRSKSFAIKRKTIANIKKPNLINNIDNLINNNNDKNNHINTNLIIKKEKKRQSCKSKTIKV